MRLSRLAAALLTSLSIVTPAAAHLGLRSPVSRYGDTVLKVGPCGVAGGTRSSHVTVLEAGSQLQVTWDEYVDHPGHFRISFDPDGDDDFADPPCLSGCMTRSPVFGFYTNPAVLLDEIADTPHGGLGSATITLPDVECSNCTLQVIQVMYDKPPITMGGDDIYYQCADLVLRRSAPTPTATATATPTLEPTSTPLPPTATRRSPPPATATRTRTPLELPDCVGDCTVPGVVTPGDIQAGIEIALGRLLLPACLPAFDTDADDQVTVDELVAAVRALDGCVAR